MSKNFAEVLVVITFGYNMTAVQMGPKCCGREPGRRTLKNL